MTSAADVIARDICLFVFITDDKVVCVWRRWWGGWVERSVSYETKETDRESRKGVSGMTKKNPKKQTNADYLIRG